MNKRDAFAIESYKIKIILKYCYSPLPDEFNTSEKIVLFIMTMNVNPPNIHSINNRTSVWIAFNDNSAETLWNITRVDDSCDENDSLQSCKQLCEVGGALS